MLIQTLMTFIRSGGPTWPGLHWGLPDTDFNYSLHLCRARHPVN